MNPQVVYAGTDIGVFRSATGGGAWESFNEGLPPVHVTAFAAQADGHIQLATYGRGTYELTTVPVGASVVAFAASDAGATESAGKVTLNVTRTGDLSVAAQVDYATTDGTASDRSDYTAAYGTLRFAAGETSKALEVFITNDVFGEGDETFGVVLSNPVNTTLGGLSSVTVNVTGDEAVTGVNPVRWDANFDPAFFVRQHYVDFFNRAFVLMQYFGYLRRNPNDPPEQNRDFTGYNFWLAKLDQFNGNFIAAEMVKAFITSDEYQRRFGP